MEMEMKDELGPTVDRLAAAAGLLEQAVERLAQRQSAFATDAKATIGRIVATVEARREAELEEKLAATEAQLASAKNQLAELEARADNAGWSSFRRDVGSRKTLPSAMTTLLAKQGVSLDASSLEAGTLDAALVSLSVEQRIAVKSQLLRAGLLS